MSLKKRFRQCRKGMLVGEGRGNSIRGETRGKRHVQGQKGNASAKQIGLCEISLK